MDKAELERLHADLLTAWNKQDATKMASFFTDNGISIGFDGSQYIGKNEIETEIGKIFKHHQTRIMYGKLKKFVFCIQKSLLLALLSE